MVMSGSVRDWSSSLALVGLVALSACAKKEAPMSPEARAVASPAAVSAAPLRARTSTTPEPGTDEHPEPGTTPCRYCNVDVGRRVAGEWQAAPCPPAGAAPVAWPASLAVVEVTEGNQKGLEFAVTTDPSSFVVGSGLSGTLPLDAKPDTWSAARLWITDANGKRCSSVLAIRR